LVQANLSKKGRLYLQNNQSKNGWKSGSSGRALPCKNKALSSNPRTTTTTKKKKKKKKMILLFIKCKINIP
jgi:hypothetical protein